MNAKRILVIVNPKSGRLKYKSNAYEFADVFSAKECEASVLTTTKNGDAVTLARDNAADYDIVVCRGGDGTLNETLNGLMQSGAKRPLGYIPAGTSNDFAQTMGIPTTVEDAVELILSGTPHDHDIGLFNSNKYFNYTACFGVFTRASYATSQKRKNQFGYGAYLYEGAKEFVRLKPIHIKVTCDGEEYEGDYIFGAATNALCVGNFLHYDESKVDFNDGLFELVLAKKPKTPKQWYDLIAGVYKKKFDERFITLLKGKEMTFESDEPVAWSLDGEFGGKTASTTISCIKSGVSIICTGKPKTNN